MSKPLFINSTHHHITIFLTWVMKKKKVDLKKTKKTTYNERRPSAASTLSVTSRQWRRDVLDLLCKGTQDMWMRCRRSKATRWTDLKRPMDGKDGPQSQLNECCSCSHTETHLARVKLCTAGQVGEEPGDTAANTFLMKLTWHSPFWTSGGHSGGTGAPAWALWRSEAYTTGDRKLTFRKFLSSFSSFVTGKSCGKGREEQNIWTMMYELKRPALPPFRSHTYLRNMLSVHPRMTPFRLMEETVSTPSNTRSTFCFLLNTFTQQIKSHHCELRIRLNKWRSIRGPTSGRQRWEILWYRSSFPRRSSDTTSH